MDHCCVPVFDTFHHRQSSLQACQRDLIVCLHFLVCIQFCAIFRQFLEERNQTGDIVQCFQTFLQQSSDLLIVQACASQCFFQLRLCQFEIFFEIHIFQIFAVHPCQLLDIEDGRRFAQASNIEFFFQFFQGEDFCVVGRAPTQQSDIVHDGFHYETFVHQIFEGFITMTFGQFMCSVTHYCRQVYIYGFFPAECIIQQVIFGCGGQIFAAAYYMSNFHQVVIHNVCEVVCGETVCFHQDLVIQFCIIYCDIAVNNVAECCCAGIRHFLTDYEGFTSVQFCLYFFLGQTQTVTVIFCKGSTFAVFFFQAFQSFLCAEAVVCFAFFHQFLCIVHIHTHSFGLYIGAVFATYIGTFIMLQACHFHCFVDHIYRAFHQSALVSIFDTQDEFTTLRFCDEVFIKRSTQVTDMHIARRRGRKSCSDFHSILPFF